MFVHVGGISTLCPSVGIVTKKMISHITQNTLLKINVVH